jgi:hypothetical protein
MESQAPTPRSELAKEKSVTMEYFLETSELDRSTADLLVKYDKDGDGSFSKDEVVAIILDLREAVKSNEDLGAANTLFKRLLTGAVIFCALLFTSMFGLSYTVAVLTATTQVQSDGTLLSAGTTTVIATDSRSNLFDVSNSEAGYCLSAAEVLAIKDSVLAGRQVLLEGNDDEGNTNIVEQLIPSGAVLDDTTRNYCFYTPEGTTVCLVPSDGCAQQRRRARRLQEGIPEPRRRLGGCGKKKYPDSNDDGEQDAWEDKCCDQYKSGENTYSFVGCGSAEVIWTGRRRNL